MKTKTLIYGLLFVLLNSLAVAQSDYQTVQNFKREYKKIESSIKDVSSLEDFNLIEKNIQNLKNDFASNRALLDKTLYPENYESALEKIENLFESRKKDFSQINSLTTQVGSLQAQVQELNQNNEKLIKQINDLQLQSEKDQAAITKLKGLVAQLKGSINQRDLLVRDLVDSLLVEFIKLPENFNQKEAQSIVSKVNKENLFYNIERTIDDNIQFLKVTRMTADDYSKIIKQHQDFNKVWKQIGPKLSSVYLTTKQKNSEISQIDSLFDEWNNQIHTSIWNGIQNLFMEKNIHLIEFTDAAGFITSATTFIDNEIKNIGIKNKNESEEIFHAFADSVYFKIVERKWIPLLFENKMMTQNEKGILDAKIEVWQKEILPAFSYWAYIIGGIFILLIAVYLYQRKQKE